MKKKEVKKIKIVLADRDTQYLTKLKRALERKGDMEVVGLTSDGLEAVELVYNTEADVVILDILLGTKDGIWVLEQFKETNTTTLNIIVSAMGTDTLVRKTIGLGADYYMAKPIQGDLLADRIYQLLGIEVAKEEKELAENSRKSNARKKEETHLATASFRKKKSETFEEEEEQKSVVHTLDYQKELQFEISTILGRMGIPASIRGYHFLRAAIMMTVENTELLNGITKGLYPDVGKEYKTTGSKVERAIRHAIESAWKKNGQEVYFEIAGYLFTQKPTNGQFIADMTEYFRMNVKQTA
ncbi:MAG: sporulation initiation factor Spo0A C-terminal domain-containing protein [Bacillota bacterium]